MSGPERGLHIPLPEREVLADLLKVPPPPDKKRRGGKPKAKPDSVPRG